MGSVAANMMTNGEWIAALKAGSGDATAALRARIRSGLRAALAGRSEVVEADLDDFTQDAVLRVLDRLDSFRGDSRFTTWAMAVAVRTSLTALRRRRWSDQPLGDRLSEFASPDPSRGSGGASGARGELLSVLRTAIAEDLTSRQRQVVLGELAGIPQVVLAERLEATPGAIYKLSHDARKKLKAALEKAGYGAQAVHSVLAE